MSMQANVVNYLNERAATAERLAIEAYKIIESLIDINDECDFHKGSKAAGMYCQFHGNFQNDMVDGMCPERRAIVWLEENEKLDTSD